MRPGGARPGATIACGALGCWILDASRHQRELIRAPPYLTMNYYEKWIAGLTELLMPATWSAQERSTRVGRRGDRPRPPLP